MCEMNLIKSNYTIFSLESPEFKDINEAVVFIGVPFGKGNFKNDKCSKFPGYLRSYMYGKNIKLKNQCNFKYLSTKIDFEKLKELIKNNQIVDLGDIWILNNENAKFTYENIYNTYKSFLEKKIVPFSIGGDHSISYPIVKALSHFHEQIQILHFDAHLDVSNSELQKKFSEEGRVTHHFGNVMKLCADLNQVKKIVHIGIRDFVNMNYELPQESIVIYNDEIESNLLDAIDPNIPTYISFDIDVLCPSLAPGTATPVCNGLFFSDIVNVLKILPDDLNVVGIDLVEVNPELDLKNQTTQIATQLISLLVNTIKL